MAIYKGDKEIVGLYKGPTEIVKRYKGSNLIYSAFKWLPYSYEHIYNSLVPSVINNKNVKDKAQVNTIYGNSVVENQQFQIYSTNQTKTLNGITMTDNRDGSYTFNGTATAETILAMGAAIPDINIGDKYLVFGGARGGSLTTYFLTQNSGGSSANDYGNGAVYTQPDNQYGRFLCVVIRNGITVNNIVVKPQHISLTQWFPFNTPTTLTDTRVQEIINRGHIPYNTGTLKNVNIGEISSEPYNLLVTQPIFNTAVVPFNSQTFTKLKANKSYTLEFSDINATSYRWCMSFYDVNGNIINDINLFAFNQAHYFNSSGLCLTSNNLASTLKTLSITPKIDCYVYVNFGVGDVISSTIMSNVSLHLTGTRTGYAPHTQPYTLPFKYQGSGVGTAHDTLEITDTEYVFTKNITEDNLSNYAFYYADSTKFLYTTRELNGCRTDSIWSPNALTNISGYKLVDSNKLSDNDVACTIYTGKFYIRNDALTEQQLKDVIANKTIKYQLATPQVVRIPKKHLGIVRIKDLTWYYVSSQNRVYSVSLDKVIKQPENNTIIGNIYCSALMSATWDAQFGTNDKIISITGQNESQGAFGIKDISCLSINDYLDKYGDYYIFYETEDEVDDILSDINIEAGGSITTNWFSWVENQNALPLNSNKWVSASAYGTLTDATATSVLYTRNQTDYSGNVPLIWQAIEGGYGSIAGHKYLIKCTITPSATFKFRAYIGTYGNVYNPVANAKNYFAEIITANSNGYLQFISENGGHLPLGGTVLFENVQCVDLTLGFGAGKEPTSINDPRIQYIIEQGYIPTNTTGTTKSVASEVLPNIDFKIKCR